jgi:hypothetical protein
MASLVGLGQREAALGAQQFVRELKQDSGAVTAGRLGASGSAMVQVRQRRQAVGDDAVRTAPLDRKSVV